MTKSELKSIIKECIVECVVEDTDLLTENTNLILSDNIVYETVDSLLEFNTSEALESMKKKLYSAFKLIMSKISEFISKLKRKKNDDNKSDIDKAVDSFNSIKDRCVSDIEKISDATEPVVKKLADDCKKISSDLQSLVKVSFRKADGSTEELDLSDKKKLENVLGNKSNTIVFK